MKWLKKWFSFKKESPPHAAAQETNEAEEDTRSTNKKRRNSKRLADPVQDGHINKKISKRDSTDFSEHLENRTAFVDKNLDLKENQEKEECDMTNLSEYELKTITTIQGIQDNCKQFRDRIDTFKETPGSKTFLFIDENLQQSIENLDKIESVGSNRIREARKNAVRYIHLLTDKLETTAKQNEEQLKPKQLRLPPISRQQFLEGKREEEL